MKKVFISMKYLSFVALLAISSCGDDEVPPEVIKTSNVRLLTVDASSDKVQLKNFGDASQDLSDYWLCYRKVYTQLSGDLDPNESIELDITLNNGSSDVGLYNANTFTDAEAMLDFMQYGEDIGTNGRVDIAITKGIWDTGAFVSGGSPYNYSGTGTQTGASTWSGVPQTSNVRLFKVDASENKFYLKNFGTGSTDISTLWICNLKAYQELSTLTSYATDLMLDADEVIGFERTLNSNTSDVGLYSNNNDFALAENLVDFMQYGSDVGTSGRVDVAVTKGIWSAGEFVDGVSPFEYEGDGIQNGASSWAGEPAVVNIRIISVNPTTNELVLKNFGNTGQDISTYWVCFRKAYAEIGTLTTSGTDLILDANEEITITSTMDDNSGDAGLYLNNSDFGSAENLVDFLQYGDDIETAGRVDVAVTKNIWNVGDFVNGVAPYTYTGDGSQTTLSSWQAASAGASNIRLLKVDPSIDEVTLKNFGNSSQDVSAYWTCALFDYRMFNTLSTTASNLILAPNEEITLIVPINDTASDVDIYETNSFGSTDAMLDFMQYGTAGNGRESVANTKGIWTTGDFIASPGPFSYTGNGSENGVGSWSN